MQLEVKLNQFSAELALLKKESLISVHIALERVGLTLQKVQYDNLQMLLELTNEYMRFLNTAMLGKKKVALAQMKECLKEICTGPLDKRFAKDFFKKTYKS
jgi:hypothetical protein